CSRSELAYCYFDVW
nr:immunoglobulin heavy chain junction region [Mus musculus]